MVRMALLGAGRIGVMHAANINANPDATLHSVFDDHAPFAQACADKFGAKHAPSLEAVLADDQVDAVLIASATNTHVDYLQAACEAGKAVLCEKPVDLDINRVEACWAAIKDKNPIVQLGFNRRFDPSFKALHDAVQAGEIGELRQLIITSRDPEVPPESYMAVSGGLLRDMTIHDFDLARFYLGEEPVRISCMAGALISPVVKAMGELDSAMIIMETASGKQCCINNYREAVYGYDQRIEAMGEKGMLKAENRRATSLERWTNSGTAQADPILYFFIERYREAYNAELDAFIQAVKAGAPVPVGFEDGRRALILANAAYESLASGRIVDIPQ